MKLSRKTCFGSKKTFLLPRSVLQLHLLPRMKTADSEICVEYSWVAVLAPPKIARGMSWATGWLMITGILAMGATNNFIGANFILGQANLSFPSYTIERWHTVLLAYLIALISTGVNIYGPHLLDRISRFILLWNILSFVIVVITILATNDHKQPASFVFHDFQNFTGFSTGFAAILGLLQSSFGMCCYDAPGKFRTRHTHDFGTV